MIVVVVVLVVGLLAAGAVLLSHNNESKGQVRTAGSPTSGATQGDGTSSGLGPATSATSTTTTTTTTTTLPTTTSSTLPGQRDIRLEPPGLLCSQIASQGFDYTAAVAYWQAQGRPPRMDVDGNGRPCETVYPPAAVRAYWHT